MDSTNKTMSPGNGQQTYINGQHKQNYVWLYLRAQLRQLL